MLTFPRGVDGGTSRTRKAFDARGIVEEDGTVRDGFDHCPMVVESLQAKDDGASRRAIQKPLHGFPERGQVWVGDAAPRNLYIRDALLAHHFIEDQQHLCVDDPTDQQIAQQPASREEMDQVIEQLLRLPIGRAVDDPFRVDDAVESAQRIETTLLKWKQA